MEVCGQHNLVGLSQVALMIMTLQLWEHCCVPLDGVFFSSCHCSQPLALGLNLPKRGPACVCACALIHTCIQCVQMSGGVNAGTLKPAESGPALRSHSRLQGDSMSWVPGSLTALATPRVGFGGRAPQGAGLRKRPGTPTSCRYPKYSAYLKGGGSTQGSVGSSQSQDARPGAPRAS